jgi:hypothetical protein
MPMSSPLPTRRETCGAGKTLRAPLRKDPSLCAAGGFPDPVAGRAAFPDTGSECEMWRFPLGRGCTRERGECKRRSQHVFGEAGNRILGIKGIDQRASFGPQGPTGISSRSRGATLMDSGHHRAAIPFLLMPRLNGIKDFVSRDDLQARLGKMGIRGITHPRFQSP